MEHVLFVEKYRPKTVEDTILPKALKKTFVDMVQSKNVPNMILQGPAGCGKTTVARALCEQLGYDVFFLNASESGNIDTLRTSIRNFASSASLVPGAMKCVILDEADYLNAQSTQPALRGFIEEFHANCRFILTCNYANRLIEPLHSRCTVIEFKIPADEKLPLCKELITRVGKILDAEKIEYTPKAINHLVARFFPDYRRILNELQRYGVNGKIDEGILAGFAADRIDELLKAMKTKDFTAVRKWVAVNKDTECDHVFRAIFDNMDRYITKSTIPLTVITLNQHAHYAKTSADPEITLTACMATLMLEAEFL